MFSEDEEFVFKEPTESPINDDSDAVLANERENYVLVPMMDSVDTLRKKVSKGHKLQKIAVPPEIEINEFRRVIAAAYMAFVEIGTGGPPRPEDVQKYLGDKTPIRRVQIIMNTPAYQAAAAARGIAVGGKTGLTVKQDYALQILLDPTQGAGLKERLRKAGITMATYKAWLKNPVFRGYIDTVGNAALKDHEADIMTSMVGRAVEGDFQTGKFLLEVSGRYNPNDKQVMDMQVFMRSVLEIIKEHVRDPDVLRGIANDVLLLSSRAGISDARQIGTQNGITDQQAETA